MPASPPSKLLDLARAYGVATEYWDWKGNQVRVSDDTIRTVLTELGVDASSSEQVQQAINARKDESWHRVLPRVVVLREGWSPWVAVHIPDGADLTATLTLEDGETRALTPVEHHVEPREIDGTLTGEATLELPSDLPLGYHSLTIESVAVDESGEPVDGADAISATAPVIVTPAKLDLPKSLEHSRAWGLMTQLYSVRSERSWGLGDAADLAELGTWAARQGADFVLVNPVHAAEPIPTMEPSPYLPTSRRFVNPMYIRVEEVPEVGYLSAAEHQMIEWHGDDARRLNSLADLDRDGTWEAKQAALRMVFRQERTHRRRRDFEEFCEREGRGLVDYATWCALVLDRGLPWSDWPDNLLDPRSEAVAKERDRLTDEVEFHCWLQWIVQSQLADAQRELSAAGMSLGVIHDLAVGVHPGGSDAWALGDVLAHGVSVGAPPDDYNQKGQDWSQPPWRPDRLAEAGYAPYRDMLRTVLRLAGGLRVDHILGLFRLWWVPKGQPATEGTYVRYDHEALVGILALEAQRAGAVVIGEDLGTVEDWVRDYLSDRGLLGTSVLWFERGEGEDGNGPKPPETYRELCLATVTTHDLPPTAGYLAGEHITVRNQLNLLTRTLEEETAEDTAQREAVLAELRRRNLLSEGASVEDQVGALHRYLTWSPAKLLGVAVPDLVGDVRTINQPGTDEEYPNWRLPLAGPERDPVSLEEVMVSRRAKRLIRCVTQKQQKPDSD